ncbi:MAG: transporter [Gammaproteobacteria bacterium]|nr:MAG: transporter [Gammaproteobacteria bacterium]
MIRNLFVLLIVILMPTSYAMELEPRRWSHIPIDTNFSGGGYAYTEADIFLDPTIQAEDVELKMDTWVGRYIRSFEWFDKTARIGVAQGYQEGKWTGLVRGTPTTVNRSGLTDTFVRLAVNLYGAPPLKGKEFVKYRTNADVETIVGVALAMRLPTGDYIDDKLINLGKNRYAFLPQLGVLHQRGKWSAELTGQAAFYTDNDDFYNGTTLEQDPLYFIHGHIVHTFRPGVLATVSLGVDYGGEATINGVNKENKKKDIGWAASFTYPIERIILKATYIGTRSQEDTGFDSDTVSAGFSFYWQ